jgi:cytochrome oxidase Cu insertion factor (SCO1/SenC/PrrC family)
MKRAAPAQTPLQRQQQIVVLMLGVSLAALLVPNLPDAWQRMCNPTVPLAHTQQQAGLRMHEGNAFTGAVTVHHPNGRIALRENFRAGYKHGLSERWAENGQQIEQRRYARGEKIGAHFGWWPSGAQRFEMNFERSVLQGAVQHWHANGFMASRLNFNDGRESGPQRSWKSDGSSEAAYDMIDGRRYGVIDSTPCPTLPGATFRASAVDTKNTTKSIALYADSMPASDQFDLKKHAPLPFYTEASFAPRWLPQHAQTAHQIGSFQLLNQASQSIEAKQLNGGITVVNFFFAGCSQVCPASIAFLREIQKDLNDELQSQGVPHLPHFWAISIDPLSDTPHSLSQYAQRMELPSWQLLTGSPDAIERLATQSFFAKSRLEAHTERAYLIDGQRRIRGIYNATQRGDLLRLREDVLKLTALQRAVV